MDCTQWSDKLIDRLAEAGLVLHRVLGDADGVLSAHRVAELSDADLLGEPSDVRRHDAGVWAYFVPLGVEVVLDRRDAPHSQVVGGLRDIWKALYELLIALGISPQWPQSLAFILAHRTQHRIQLDNHVHHLCDPPWPQSRLVTDETRDPTDGRFARTKGETT